MPSKRKKLDGKTKIIIFLGLLVLILGLILGSRSTIHGIIPVDAMRDPIPFRQSCQINLPDETKPEN